MEVAVTPVSKNDRYSAFNPLLCITSDEQGYALHDSCYIPVNTEKIWSDAENYCVDKYQGHLITIKDFTVQRFLDYLLSGLTNPLLQWIGINATDSKSLKWSSGWFVSFSKWEDPNFERKDTNFGTCAVRLNTGHWGTRSCNEKLPFFCEVSKVSAPPPLNKLEGFRCPDGNWKDLGGDRCYFFKTDEPCSWYQANFECIRKGGTLASIHSHEELNLMEQFLKVFQRSTFIGLYRGEDSKFRWSDGSSFEFSNWDPDEPNNKAELCVEMVSESMGWNDIGCGAINGYVCSIFKVAINASNDTLYGPSSLCTEGLSPSSVAGVSICVLAVLILVIVFLYFFRPWETDQRNPFRKISQDMLQAAKANQKTRCKPPELIIIDDNVSRTYDEIVE